MIPHHQAIAPISMFAEIARELAKTHPIKLEPSHTPLPKYTSIKHQRFGRDYGAAAIHRQRQTILHHQAIAQHSNYQENCLRTWEDTPNQARTFLHTSHNSHSPQLNIAVWKQSRTLSRHPMIHNGPSQPGKQSRCSHHPPTTPNDPSPPVYCQPPILAEIA